MAIRVRHEVPLDVAGAFSQAIGDAQGAAQGAALDAETTRFLLQMAQRDRLANQGAELHALGQQQAQQRFYAGMAAQDASRRLGYEANLLNADRARQAVLLRDQQNFSQDLGLE